MYLGRAGQAPGMIASRRSMQLTSSREPLRHNLWDKLVEYWPLCEPNGARLGLILGKQQAVSGSAPNVGVGVGLASLAATFPGVAAGVGGQYLSRTSDASLQCGNIAFTIAGWFNFTNNAFAGSVIVKDDGGSQREHAALRLQTSTDRLYGNIFDGTSTTVAVPAAGQVISLNTWYFGATTYAPGSPGTMTQFLNTSKQTGTATGTPGVSAAPLCIGGDTRSFNSSGLGGSVMRAGLWKRVLSDDELAYLYNGGQGRDYPWI